MLPVPGGFSEFWAQLFRRCPPFVEDQAVHVAGQVGQHHLYRGAPDADGGACGRGIYDNMKTAVESVFIGKDRAFNQRFLQMCGHYLVEPTACTPASGWGKGQVEDQVGPVRERFFTPRLKVGTSINSMI